MDLPLFDCSLIMAQLCKKKLIDIGDLITASDFGAGYLMLGT